MVNLDTMKTVPETETLHGDDGARDAAPDAGFGGEFVAHRRDPMQSARRGGVVRAAAGVSYNRIEAAEVRLIVDRFRARTRRKRKGTEKK